MAAIILPRKHYTQPQGRVEIAPEWMRDVLSLGWLPQDPRLQTDDKAMGGFRGPHGEGIGQDGPVVTFNGSQRLRKQASTGASALFNVPLLLVVRCTATSSAAGESYAVSVGSFNVNSGLCRVGRNGSALFVQFRNTANLAASVSFTSGVQVGVPVTLVGLFNPGESLLFYQNGRLLGSASMPASGELLAEMYGVGHGRPSDGIQGWIGSVAMAGFLIGSYSAEEAQSLSVNPYQIFRADPHRIYSLPPVITIPTLSSPGVIDIGTTSARPQVTLTY